MSGKGRGEEKGKGNREKNTCLGTKVSGCLMEEAVLKLEI